MTSSSETLHAYIKTFDRVLTSTWMSRTTAKEKALVLSQVERFYQIVEAVRPEIEKNPALKPYLSTGCRLAADVTQRVQAWGIEQLEQSEHELLALKDKMQKRLSQRFMSQQLLSNSQKLLNQTQSVGTQLGLGAIL